MYFKSVNRGLNFTVLGRYLVAMTFSVGALAMITGVNGMFLFLGVSLGLFAVSGLLSEKNIRNIQFYIGSNARFFEAGKENSLTYKVANKSSQTFIYSQHIEVYLTPRSTSFFKPKRPLCGYDFVIQIQPNETLSRELKMEHLSRGEYKNLYIEQNTKFPFGIFEKFKVETVSGKIFVLPPIKPENLNLWKMMIQKLRTVQTGLDDFSSHQKYQIGAPTKLIDWKKNAGKPISQWVSKQYESDLSSNNIILKAISNDFSSGLNENFESLLSNMRTGLEVLHLNGFHCHIHLGHLGYASSYTDAKILLSRVQLTSKHNLELPHDKYFTVIYVDQQRAWVSHEKD